MESDPGAPHLRALLAQHPGGLIWEPHQGKMRIPPETR